ncbi:MAG: hypothetical protein E4H13_11650 [Calditrichales bacterium]|nr:MAG: hypothetical protein E4H13_11650 [Calditrichales bacterium]
MKQTKWLLCLLSILMAGCAAYKELQPEPQVSSLESGYIEIIDKDEKFELSEGKKYFVRFPRPERENTYLVLDFKDKDALSTYLTRVFDDGEGTIIKINDESDQPITISVYPLDQTVPEFFWVIDNVSRDVVLDLNYRYVAVWRYKFERKHQEFKSILEQNTQSKSLPTEIGVSVNLSDIDYATKKKSLLEKTKNIEQVSQQMHEIESLFPANIRDTNDRAYLDYVMLKTRLAEELLFQKKYSNLLELLEVIGSSKPNIEKLITLAPEYAKLLKDRSTYPGSFYTAVSKDLGTALSGVTPYFEQQLRKKTDVSPIKVDIQPLLALANETASAASEDLTVLSDFITAFNNRAGVLANIQDQLKTLNQTISTASPWPSNTFYAEKREKLSRLKYELPSTDLQAFGRYKSYPCVGFLNKAINALKSDLYDLDSKFQRADMLVPQINLARARGDYNEVLRLLKQNGDLTFLIEQYGELDELSLTQHRQTISRSLRANDFVSAEQALKKFELDKNFLNLSKILPRKEKLVTAYEDSLREKIRRVSIDGANRFIDTHQLTLSGVDSLYQNPALFPAYALTYDRKPGSTARFNKELTDQMNTIRQVKFPETAIDAIYRAFTDAMHIEGVEKARAVVSHGSHYQGNQWKTKNLIAECDPGASKWVTKPMEYRKIYALPVTSNPGGNNTYVAKINLQIPSDAKFPVYDVNIRLPQEVARHAGNKQWYDKITFNKNVLKNEGRFTITAPDKDNDYIAQITPLQVNKTGDNVIEIRFDYQAFKVLEISIMAQKPIIKKN